MAKPTKEDQPFVYQLGQDVAKMGFEIEKLKSKSVKAIRIIVPAKPDRYKQYSLRAVISLPAECQHAICIKSQGGEIDLIETKETLSAYAEDNASEFYLAPIYRLEADTINAAFDQEQMTQIESDVREREEREERKNREESIYKYLAKWLTDNYLEDIRVKAADRSLEAQGIKVYVNKNGLSQLLDKPFERNSNLESNKLDESIYADAKSAMLAEKARIDRGEVDLSVASDFNVVDYNYTNDWL